jgi:hypothetical protein
LTILPLQHESGGSGFYLVPRQGHKLIMPFF